MRVGPAIETCRLRRRNADRTKQEYRSECGADLADHWNLLIVMFLHGLAVSN
jgi:hypothetical protein